MRVCSGGVAGQEPAVLLVHGRARVCSAEPGRAMPARRYVRVCSTGATCMPPW